MKKSSFPSASSSLEFYLSKIDQFPLLTAADEQSLARTYREKGDARAAHRLVTANLRFVVKVAYEYRSYGFGMADLIQEGNIGLMEGVKKFDPDKGVRLISYAVWWIRAYIQNYVMKYFSLVKLGTTQAQRKLFYALARTKRELDRTSHAHGADSDGEDSSKIAKKLRVKPAEVDEMTQRMMGRDLSLDAPMAGESKRSHVDLLAGDGPSQDQQLAAAQERAMLQGRIGDALARLDQRERYIIERRILSEKQMTLREIGGLFGFSRERARQLEVRAKEKLKQALRALAVEIDWPTATA